MAVRRSPLMISTPQGRVEAYAALDVVAFARAGLLPPGDPPWMWDEAGGATVRVISLGNSVEIRVAGGAVAEIELS